MLGDERQARRPAIVHLCGRDERATAISYTVTSDCVLVKEATLGVYAIDPPRWRRPFASRPHGNATEFAQGADDVDITRVGERADNMLATQSARCRTATLGAYADRQAVL
jgi:hypothetical protein